MLNFLHPWLFFLAPLPWLARLLLPPRRPAATALRVPFGRRLERALAALPLAGSGGRPRTALLVPTLAWLLVLAALARPQWIEPPIERQVPTKARVALPGRARAMPPAPSLSHGAL